MASKKVTQQSRSPKLIITAVVTLSAK